MSRVYIYAAVLLAVFSAGWVANGWRLNAYYAEQERARVAQINSELLRRQTAIEGIRKDAQEQIATADAGRAAAESAADGLRAEIARYRKRTCPTERGDDSGESLLAQLLDEVEREGRAMAQQADAAGIAARACEKAYGQQRSSIAAP